MNSELRESAIGVAAASFSIFVLIALMGGGTGIGDVVALMPYVWIGPLLYVRIAPLLLALYVLGGYLVVLQYRRVPLRFIRYLVGAEAVVWQLFGLWCVGRLMMQ